MTDLKLHIQIAIGYFLIIAAIGLVLRMYQIIDIPADYRFVVHTHSHVALLGWIYTALTTLIYLLFLADKPIFKRYKLIFWCTQITIAGMMLSFPFTGYAMFSILFSTLFLLVSYWFTYFFLKNVTAEQKQTHSFKLVRMALFYMIISSFGPWALGGIMTTLGSSSPWYRNAIYFFLHFQYNGWFIVALCGYVFMVLEKNNIVISRKKFQAFFGLLNTGVVLTFFLSILWMKPHPVFYLLAGIGALLQLLAFGSLFLKLNTIWPSLKKACTKKIQLLLIITAVLLTIKLIAQCMGAIPLVAQIVSSNIDLVISYLHWTFLGVVSLALLGFLNHFKIIYLSKEVYLLYLTGFLLTEALITYKGMIVWLGGSLLNSYYQLLILASGILVTAIAVLLIQQFSKPLNDRN
jgi:hypothetical protein